MRDLHTYDYVSIDVETKGVRWWEPEEGVFGIAIATCEGESMYFDIREEPEKLDWLKKQNPKKVVNHNIKFDIHMLRMIGVFLDVTVCECTMVRGCLIDEHLREYSLDALSSRYLGKNKESNVYADLKKLFGGMATRNVQIKNLHKAPVHLVSKYATVDVELAIELWEWQEKEIAKQKLEKIWELEKKLLPVVVDMEMYGVRIDVANTDKAILAISKQYDSKMKELNELVGFECNINARKHMEALFKPFFENGRWFACDGTSLETNKATAGKVGSAKLDKKALQEITLPEAQLIVVCKRLHKCRDTFLKGHLVSHLKDGYVHPNINQTKGSSGGTITGRLSVTEPALQQIPARDKEIASVIRPLFLPDEGFIWACWDYSQFEYRVFSHYVNDQTIIDKYESNPRFDFHQLVADMTGLPRNAPSSGGPNAKQLNLSMIYDMGGASIARTLQLPVSKDPTTFTTRDGEEISYYKAGDEATKIIENYHEAIPGVRLLAKNARETARKRGYLMSLAGRHLRFPNKRSIAKAKALLCQGSSADCMKVKMIEVHNYLKTFGGRLYLSVHDEINVGLPKDKNMLKHCRNITKLLENYGGEETGTMIKLKVPIKTDFGLGINWAQASGKGA